MCRMVFLISSVLMALAAASACVPRSLPPAPATLTFQPGQYVKESFFAPGFKPEDATYALTTFTVAEASGAASGTFLKLFQEELGRAFQDQGLKLSDGAEAVRLSGDIHHLALRGGRLRVLTGRLHAVLTISGAITRGEQVLFAFRDRVAVSSPLAPGPGAPKEQELLLRQLAREAVHHLLNELLLHGVTADSG